MSFIIFEMQSFNFKDNVNQLEKVEKKMHKSDWWFKNHELLEKTGLIGLFGVYK